MLRQVDDSVGSVLVYMMYTCIYVLLFVLLVSQSFPVYPVRSPVAHSRSTARGVVGALQRALQNPPKVSGCPDFPRRRTENIRFNPAVWQAPQRADKVGLFRVFLLGTMITYFTFSWCGLPFLLGLPREY